MYFVPVLTEPPGYRTFLEQRHIMPSAFHRRADVQHKTVLAGQHLGHDGEGLFLAGVVTFAFLLVLGAGNLLLGSIHDDLFKLGVRGKQFADGADTFAAALAVPFDEQPFTNHASDVSNRPAGGRAVTVEEIAQQVIGAEQFGIDQETQQTVFERGQFQFASAAECPLALHRYRTYRLPASTPQGFVHAGELTELFSREPGEGPGLRWFLRKFGKCQHSFYVPVCLASKWRPDGRLP